MQILTIIKYLCPKLHTGLANQCWQNEPLDRQNTYHCGFLYGTNSRYELGFLFLLDQNDG